MRRQTTRNILMVRPANFGFNTETAANNAFQKNSTHLNPAQISAAAVAEFDAFVKKLKSAGVNVLVVRDSKTPVKPDAVFPNNWVTFHQEGFVITYPMFSPARRRERRRQVIEKVLESGFKSDRRVNLEFNEKLNCFLEGTGSIIFDHEHQLSYACLSPRTDARLLEELCQIIGYYPIVFHSTDKHGQDIYHTNVMMALGETFVVICLDSVRDAFERKMLVEKFRDTGKEIVEITQEQMEHFAGNMLQVRNNRDETILVMSATAYQSLSESQIKTLQQHTKLLHADINIIETYGGGSARCMMSEIFLPEQ